MFTFETNFHQLDAILQTHDIKLTSNKMRAETEKE